MPRSTHPTSIAFTPDLPAPMLELGFDQADDIDYSLDDDNRDDTCEATSSGLARVIDADPSKQCATQRAGTGRRRCDEYTVDFDDDGRWYVIPPQPDQRRILCGDRRGALLTLACIVEADDADAEFGRIWDEVEAAQR